MSRDHVSRRDVNPKSPFPIPEEQLKVNILRLETESNTLSELPTDTCTKTRRGFESWGRGLWTHAATALLTPRRQKGGLSATDSHKEGPARQRLEAVRVGLTLSHRVCCPIPNEKKGSRCLSLKKRRRLPWLARLGWLAGWLASRAPNGPCLIPSQSSY